MLRQFSARRIIGSFILDLTGTFIALFLATYLRVLIESAPFALPDPLPILQGFWSNSGWLAHLLRPQVVLLVGILWPFFLAAFGVYDGRRSASRKTELANVFFATCTAVLALAGFLFLTYRETSRGLFLFFFAFDLLFLLGGRGLFFVYRSFRNGRGQAESRQVLIVGAGEVGLRVAAELSRYAARDIQVLGFLDDDLGKVGGEIAGYPVLGTLNAIAEVSKELHIQDAVVALPLRAHQRLIEVARSLQDAGVHVHVVPDLFALSFPNASLDGFGGIPVVDLGQPAIQGEQRALKRAFDILAASIFLILISPLLLALALLVRLSSPGPVFYRQARIGEKGRPFIMYKFRSMHVDTGESLHKSHVTRLIRENLSPEQLNGEYGGTLKMEKDPRVTRIGHFIRKTSLDELPQFFNVLRGEMSIVGPRPPLPYEYEIYQDWHKRRLEAPQGITGLWQVKARNQVSFDEMVRLDLEYIEKYSFWLDIKLILQTPWALINSKGAG